MSEIENITIQFNCPESPDDRLFCSTCARTVVDFTGKTSEELDDRLQNSGGRVCGLFRKSQLSDQFLRFAAATLVTASLSGPVLAQVGAVDSVQQESLEPVAEDDVFLGTIVETMPEPVGGYEKFYAELMKQMKFPAELKTKGKVYVELTVDTTGHMQGVRMLKGFNEFADREAVRVLTTLDYPFKPGTQRGKPIAMKMVVPIAFDPQRKGRR